MMVLLFRRLRWMLRNRVHRVELIQTVADVIGARRYLEIGVRDGRTICALRIPERVGVDPAAPNNQLLSDIRSGAITYHQMTSDEFFRQTASARNAPSFDIVFIDGLHTYRQSYSDAINALQYLSPAGIILLHDCSPQSAARAAPAPSLEALQRCPPPGWDGYWNGEVWKTILHFRATRPDLGCYTLETDQGIGVVSRWLPHECVSVPPIAISDLTYADLARQRRNFLGLRRPVWLLQQLQGHARATRQ